MPPAVETWSLNHWTAREVPIIIFKALHTLLCFTLCVYMFSALPDFEVLDYGICVLYILISHTVLSTQPCR